MTGPTALETPVRLTREDAWHQHPAVRLQELRKDVQLLQEAVARANAVVRSSAVLPRALTLARSTLKHLEGRLLERRRYVVTFRRQHRI